VEGCELSGRITVRDALGRYILIRRRLSSFDGLVRESSLGGLARERRAESQESSAVTSVEETIPT
jgi:hypothetical protein